MTPSGYGHCLHDDAWQPPVDIYQQENALVVVVELPGVQKDQIKVSIDGGVLCITGRRAKQLPQDTRHILQMEIPYGAFSRSVRLPVTTVEDSIEAEYQDGYLTVRIPQAPSGGLPDDE